MLKSFYEGRLTAGQLMGALCEATELAARAGETRAEPAQRRAA